MSTPKTVHVTSVTIPEDLDDDSQILFEGTIGGDGSRLRILVGIDMDAVMSWSMLQGSNTDYFLQFFGEGLPPYDFQCNADVHKSMLDALEATDEDDEEEEDVD